MTKTNQEFIRDMTAKLDKLTPEKQAIARIAIRRIIDNLLAEPPVIEDIDIIIARSAESLDEIDEIREQEAF